MDLRKCTKCGKEKILEEFVFNKGQNSYEYKCQLCNKEYKKEWHVRNKKTIFEQKKQYRAKNKKVLQEKSKRYCTENKEARRESGKRYYINNKEDCQERQKQYRLDNKETIKERRKLYYLENKQIIQKQNNKYHKKRIKNDINFKLRTRLSTSIYISLKRNDFSKNGLSCIRYLPYTIQELRHHLESLFESWMTWKNQGKYNCTTWNDNDPTTWTWQIDHIIPHSMFTYSSMDCQEFKNCWALSNLRPYSAKQNILDGVSRVRHKKEHGW